MNITGSYLQDQKHSKVSESYNVITKAAVGEVMAENGLTLASLSTGKARDIDKVDFQKTMARYRGEEVLPGIFLDLLHIGTHMGRGTDQIMLGIYRLVCTNGLFVGSNFFSSKVRHSGDTYNSLSESVHAALAKQAELTDLIKAMQSIQLTSEQEAYLMQEAVTLLVPKEAQRIQTKLNRVRRLEDTGKDLWSTFNRIQENAVKGGTVQYMLDSIDAKTGHLNRRVMRNRAIKPNTGKDAAFNSAFFDIAAKLVA